MLRKRSGVLALLFAAAMLLAACAPAAAPAPAEPTSPPPAVAAPTAAPTSEPPQPASLTIFAAASLTDVFQTIGERYEQDHPGTELVFNFGASSALRTQLIEGAAADVVAFAGMKDMQHLQEAGLVDSQAARAFAANELVVVVHPDSVDRVAALDDLAKPGVKVVIAAEGVPAGDYARQALQNLAASTGSAYRDGVLANVVSEEDNVRQVLAKVQLGEVDAGWVYRSDAHAAPELIVIEIPADANVRAEYPIAVPVAAPNAEAAQRFVDLVLSAQGQDLIQAGGLIPVAP